MSSDWPFSDARNTAVFTTRDVLERGRPILRVTHDDDDGSWQFHCGETVSAVDAMIIGLGEMVAHDPTIQELADLPTGWIATRETNAHDWVRQIREEHE